MSGLSQPVTVFGINNITLLDYTSKQPLATAIFKVPAELSIPMSTGIEKLFGGANKYIIEAEPTYMSGEIAMKFKQYDAGLWAYMSAASVTTTTSESTTGAVTAITNAKGTSVVAATGLASVSLISADVANLKAGLYTIVAAGSTTIDVYASTDVDFNEGAAVTYIDNSSKILAGLSVTMGGDTTLTGLGVKVTGGAGTIGMTIGDSATFTIRPANVSNTVTIIGQSNVVYKKFSMYAAAQKKGSGEIFEFYAPKIQPYGFDMPWNEYKFSETAPKAILLQSAAENMICQFTRILRVTG